MRGNGQRGGALEDEELIGRAQHGDTAAFEELVRRHQEVAFRAAFLILKDAGDAEDASQEALMKAYRFLHRFRTGAAFRPWLLKIVVNQALTLAKGRRRRAETASRLGPGRLTGSDAETEEAVIGIERARALRQALDALREQERVIIYLRYFLSLPEKEMAEYLGCAPGTVKSRLHRALSALREIVVRRYPELTGEPV